MIVLGIDPGYERLGVAIIKQQNGTCQLLYSDCLTTPKKDSLGKRLVVLGEEIEKIINNWKPEVIATEKLFFTINKKTALAVAETRGIILYLSAKNNIDLFEYTPLEIKSCITGYGNANKEQVAKMTSRLIKINKTIKYDDEYDAIGIALTHLARSKFTLLSTSK